MIAPIELPPRRVVGSMALAILSLAATVWAARYLYASTAPPHQSLDGERSILAFLWAAFSLALAAGSIATAGAVRDRTTFAARILAALSVLLSVVVIGVLVA